VKGVQNEERSETMSYANVNGLSLYYEEHGSGDPLVLLHGGISAGEMFGARLAPRVEDWPVLIAKTAELLHADYDWTAEAERLQPPTMLVFADADSVRPAHIVEFYALLGGGLRDANWDGSLRPTARLAILPGTTHYDVYASPALAPAVVPFLDAEL
jgi:pimeloyl-ACP methyl ester carboxylesterase